RWQRTTKIFVDNTKTFVDSTQHHVEIPDSPADRRRTGDPEGAVEPGRQHGPPGPRRLVARAPDGVYDRPQDAPDHDREGAGPPRRARPDPRLLPEAQRGSDPASARARPPRSGIRGIGVEARDAGARGQAGVGRRARGDPEAARDQPRGEGGPR